MLKVDTTPADTTIVLDGYPHETPCTSWRVQHVEALEGYELRVTFRDGLTGVVRMQDRVHRADAGVFRSLADPVAFADVSAVFGAVTWGNGVDLAPDAMYDEIQRTGVWVLR
jgi:hypothetical protein